MGDPSTWQRLVVLVEAWQHQCCGKPFAKGDTVTWTVAAATDFTRGFLGDELGAGVTDVEDHHTAGPPERREVTGRIHRIQALFGTGGALRHEKRPAAVRWERSDTGQSFAGYLVEVDVD